MKSFESTEIEEKFFRVVGLAEPVVKKWYYEGYYEDFSWNFRYENCSKILEKNNFTLEEYNNKIQKAKEKAKKLDKKNKSEIYHYLTDSVDTPTGRISRACWMYPFITNKILLELICLLSSKVYQVIKLSVYNVDELKEFILQEFIDVLNSKYTKETKKKKIVQRIRSIFEKEEREERW